MVGPHIYQAGGSFAAWGQQGYRRQVNQIFADTFLSDTLPLIETNVNLHVGIHFWADVPCSIA